MIPIVALIGRQNVGKSTLFNYLTHTRNALVADFPGLTHDRKYGYAKIAGHAFICIDTGGIYAEREYSTITSNITKQALFAIEEADIILFIVDAQAGLLSGDRSIAKHLRSCKKPIILVINKIDGINVNQVMTDFFLLGFDDAYLISATQGRGIVKLLKLALLPRIDRSKKLLGANKNVNFLKYSKLANINEKTLKGNIKLQQIPIKLAVVGQPNVGKSTLTNCLLGEERMVVHDTPGTTRDSIYIPIQHNNCDYILIDTAGIRKRSKIQGVVEKFSIIKTLQVIKDANVILLVIDASKKELYNQDLSLLKLILDSGRALVIVMNKYDTLSKEWKKKIKNVLNNRLKSINFIRVHFISALYSMNINSLFKSIHEAYSCATKQISTSSLTRIMTMAVEAHQPIFKNGYHIKLKYAHPGGYNPPTIIIHGSKVNKLPESYKRYLINYFRKSLNIIGTPIYISFKENRNSFYL